MSLLSNYLPQQIDLKKTKVKFNINPRNPNEHAWDILRASDLDIKNKQGDRWIEMNEWKTTQANHNLEKAKWLIALAQLYPQPFGPCYYVFGGLFEILASDSNVEDGRGYDLALLNDGRDYIKRLVIRIDKPVQQSILRWAEEVKALNPELFMILPPV